MIKARKVLIVCGVALSACARTPTPVPPVPLAGTQDPPLETIRTGEPVASKPVLTDSQAKPISADKKPARVIFLGPTEEIESLGSFKALVEKKPEDPDFEKWKIEYLLERLGRTSYNLVRNGETHGGKTGAAHLRYKWVKYRSEAATAKDFVVNVASGSRTSGDPYYVKADRLYYPTRDVFLYELEELDRRVADFKSRRINEGEHLETVSQI